MTYPTRLLEIGITLLEPFTGAKTHHLMRCNNCSHEWTATPLSKTQAYKKYGYNGCPECNKVRIEERNNITRQQNKQILTNKGLLYPDWWTGQRVWDKDNTPIQLPVIQTKCGHKFTSTVQNLLSRGVICSVCGIEERTTGINKSSKGRSEEWKKTADIWQLYKSKVTRLSKISYKNNKDKINPNNLSFGRAGKEGAHHLDHIVPVRYCFEHYIPEELCSHPDNLQILGWRENIGSRDKLKEYVPNIFVDFIRNL